MSHLGNTFKNLAIDETDNNIIIDHVQENDKNIIIPL